MGKCGTAKNPYDAAAYHMTELKAIKERYIESTEIGRMIKN